MMLRIYIINSISNCDPNPGSLVLSPKIQPSAPGKTTQKGGVTCMVKACQGLRVQGL